MIVWFEDIYGTRRHYDPDDFTAAQTAYPSSFVSRMPVGSPAIAQHAEVRALSARVSDVVFTLTEYWDGPLESWDYRIYREYLGEYEGGDSPAYDLADWVHMLLVCTQGVDHNERVSNGRRFFFSDKEERARLKSALGLLSADLQGMALRIQQKRLG